MKKKVIDITRETKLKLVEDIVGQLDHVSQNDPNSVCLLMPWDYSIDDFESDSEYRNKLWEQEKVKENSQLFQDFESKMEKKHADLVAHLDKWSTNIENLWKHATGQPLSFANAVSGNSVLPSFNSIVPPLQVPPTLLVPPEQFPPIPPQGSRQNAGVYRPRSNSKRRRTEDGYVEDDQGKGQPPPRHQGSHPQNKNVGKSKPKPIIGTSDSSANGRKMRTPPADIFVWGVHPSTSVEDIVNDLEASGISVSVSDIEKKSNPEAKLCSYRVSVPATLLEKALDPGIWPLRVKVREFIHYSNRPKQPRNNGETDKNSNSSERSSGASGSSSNL